MYLPDRWAAEGYNGLPGIVFWLYAQKSGRWIPEISASDAEFRIEKGYGAGQPYSELQERTKKPHVRVIGVPEAGFEPAHPEGTTPSR